MATLLIEVKSVTSVAGLMPIGNEFPSCSPRDGYTLLTPRGWFSCQPVLHFSYRALCGADSASGRGYWSFGIGIGEEDSV